MRVFLPEAPSPLGEAVGFVDSDGLYESGQLHLSDKVLRQGVLEHHFGQGKHNPVDASPDALSHKFDSVKITTELLSDKYLEDLLTSRVSVDYNGGDVLLPPSRLREIMRLVGSWVSPTD